MAGIETLLNRILQMDNPDGGGGGAGVSIATITTNLTLTASGAAYQILTPTTGLNVTLPDSTTCPGRVFVINNRAATDSNLAIVQSAADGGATIVTLAPGEEVEVVSTGAPATGFVRVQLDPTSANVNVAALGVVGAITLNSTAALSRHYQRLSATAALTITLPLSDTTPGGWFVIENVSDAGLAFTLAADAGDPALTAVVRPGEWALLVSVPVAGYVIAARSNGDNTTVNGDANVVLTATSTSVQTVAPAAATRTVLVSALGLATLAGRRVWVKNVGTNPLLVVNILSSTGPDVIMASLGIGDSICLVGSTAGTAPTIVALVRSDAVNVELLAAARVLVSGDLSNQVLDPGGAARLVDLPAPALSNAKSFQIRNSGDNPTLDILTVETSALAFLCALGPGDVGSFSFNGTEYVLSALTRAPNANVATLAAADLVLTTTGVAGSPRTAYPIQLVDPNGAAQNVDLPALSGLAPLHTWRIVNTANAGGNTETLTIRGSGAATLIVLQPTQEATLQVDDSVAGDYRVIGATLGGFFAYGALGVGPTPIRFGNATLAYGAGGGGADTAVRLPNEVTFAGAVVTLTVTASGVAGDDVTINGSAGGLVLALVGNTGNRTVILACDGVVWNVVANLANP